MKSDARKLSSQEQRVKRSTALRMREQGYTFKAIGEAVDVHPLTIAHWVQVAEHKDKKAAIAGCQRGVRQGDRRSLSPSQVVLVRTLMTDKMPDRLKLGFALWTRDAVRELIRQRCGFLMSVRTVGEYLKRWAAARSDRCIGLINKNLKWSSAGWKINIHASHSGPRLRMARFSGVAKPACTVTAMPAAAAAILVKRRCARSVAVVFPPTCSTVTNQGRR